jgi:phospholipid/cholesterol/gamma-HCH transport system substrate-binding protein
VIGADRTRLPTSDADLLRKANALVASVPPPALRTTVDELGAALGGRSGDLRRVLDAATLLARDLDRNMVPVQRLVDDLGPVLDTQQALSPRIGPLFGDLATVTAQLRASDGHLRGLVEKSPDTLRAAC